MADKSKTENVEPVVPMLRSDFLSVIVLGGVLGLLLWGLGFVLNRFVFDALLCQGDTSGQCVNAKDYAAATVGLIGGVLALLALIRLRVYRPLLVLLASLISLWGIVQLSWNYSWYIGVLIVIAMYATAFAAFSWITRVRVFWIALVATIVLVVAVRLAIAL